MGMFKDLKGMVDVARSDELKDMRKMAQAQPRTSMMDTLRTGNAALAQAAQMTAPLTNGVAAEATINSVEATGTLVNHTPILAFDLTVTLPGQAPYAVKHTQMVSPVDIPRLQAGATVSARVAADDPNSVFLGA